MKILVTGGSGFIGTNLISFYLSKGADVRSIDVRPPQNSNHRNLWKEVDVRNLNELTAAISQFRPEFVIHMAARADLRGKTLTEYSANVLGVENLIRACNQVASVRKVVFASSMLVCRVGHIPSNENDYCPPNLYGESKVIGEKIVKQGGIRPNFRWVIVRPTSIWGPWFGPTYRAFFEMIIKRRYVNFTGAMSIKTYGFIGNVVYQIDSILKSDLSSGKTFYLGDYAPTNIKDWANEIAVCLGVNVPTVPKSLIWISAKIGDVLQKFKIGFPMNSFRLKNMTTNNVVPLEPTKAIAPMTIYERSEGNRITIDWMKNHFLRG